MLLKTLSTFAGLMPVLQLVPSQEVLLAAVELQSNNEAIRVSFWARIGYAERMDRVAAAVDRLSRVRDFALAAREAGPPCHGCAYRGIGSQCMNPVMAEQSFDPATGRYRETYSVLTRAARTEAGLCGPEALLFEPRSEGALAVEDAGRASWAVIRVALLAVAAMVFLYSVILR